MTKLDVNLMENWLFWSLCIAAALGVILSVFRVHKSDLKKKVDE